ncbi:hypothetical protein, partial [Acinetobacter baumannii]|uniref:hypothetical protein n=1 Tax=Acinetobacter baumannii TaxID=470 RepID=UPI001C06669B
MELAPGGGTKAADERKVFVCPGRSIHRFLPFWQKPDKRIKGLWLFGEWCNGVDGWSRTHSTWFWWIVLPETFNSTCFVKKCFIYFLKR